MTTAEDRLRLQVREFVADWGADPGVELLCDSWLSGFSPPFSRALGRRGWLGMTWPTAYGGHARPERDRWIVNEELLAAGAPVAAHWIADRQSGPAILKHGTQEQRHRFLPEIARGECFFAIGMSEPDSGSDLASVRSTGTRTGAGWRLDGAKIWTSHAHRAHRAITLVRTSPVSGSARHAGLSQFLLDLAAPGVSVIPIRTLDGQHHFNEVVLDGVLVPDQDLLGREGEGWAQVTSELAYERSGAERFLSTFPLLAAVQDRAIGQPPDAELGRVVADLVALRAMSAAVAEALGRGEAPAVQAAMVKDLGTRFESGVVDLARRMHPGELDPGSADELQRQLTQAVRHAPGFTLRGGTTEVLRGIVARAVLGVSAAEIREVLAGLAGSAELWDASGAWSPDGSRRLLERLMSDGWHRVGLPEELGGAGGGLADGAAVAAALAPCRLPLADVVVGAARLLARSGLRLPDDAGVVVVAARGDVRLDGSDLVGRAHRVPWASWSTHLLVPVAEEGSTRVALVRTADCAVRPGSNLAGEARDDVEVVAVPVASAVLESPLGQVVEEVERLGAVTRAVQIAAVLEEVLPLCSSHVRQRHQFGRPLAQFQAVQQLVAELAAEVAVTRAVVDLALQAPDRAGVVACAKVRAGQAAGAVARIAHQLHGAVGISQEHRLHRSTACLWSWRDEYGNEQEWAVRISQELCAAGAPGLWSWLTGT